MSKRCEAEKVLKESIVGSNFEFASCFPKLFSCIKVFRKEKNSLVEIRKESKKAKRRNERKEKRKKERKSS